MTDYTNGYPTQNDSEELRAILKKSAQTVIKRLGFVPSAVIDFGCNIGQWLRAFEDAGSILSVGIDHSKMEAGFNEVVPRGIFRPFDLASDVFHSCINAELVVCLEVAEHLPEQAADTLIETLCANADVVLFSAAPPGQGGLSHINEQPFDYWEEKFASRGYVADISIRKDLPVALKWWYRNNMAIFRKATQ
jgi:SAM-dependent methyltransferase